MPYDDYAAEYEAAPATPTSPITVPLSEAQARAVAVALKVTDLPPGAVTAAGAAGLLISELQHRGWQIVPIGPDPECECQCHEDGVPV